MKTNSTTSRKGNRIGFYRVILTACLCVAAWGATVKAQAASEAYTVYVTEGETTVTLPFKKANNVKHFLIETKETALQIVAVEPAATQNTAQLLRGSFSDVLNGDATGRITFNLFKASENTPLGTGTYNFTIVMSSEADCSGEGIPFRVCVVGKPAIELMDPAFICEGVVDNLGVTAKSYTTDPGAVSVEKKYKWSAAFAAAVTAEQQAKVTGFSAGDGTTEYAYTDGMKLVDATLGNTNVAPVTVTYTVTPVAVYTYNRGGKDVKVTVEGDPVSVDITVNPQVDIQIDAAYAFCNGNGPEVTLKTDNEGGTDTYTWTVKDANANITGADNGTGAGFNPILSHAQKGPETVVYTVVHRYENGGTGCEASKDVTLTVLPVLDVTADDATICSAGTTDIALGTTNTGGTSSYSWTVKENSNGVVIAAPAGVTEADGVYTNTTEAGKLAMTLTNNGNGAATVVFTVKHTFVVNSVSCEVSKDVTVTVNPVLNVVIRPDEGGELADNGETTVCSATEKSVGFATDPAIVSGVVFTWSFDYDPAKFDDPTGTGVSVSDKDGSLKTASGTGDFKITLKNKSNTAEMIVVTVKAAYNGSCEVTKTFRVNVNPQPTFELGE